MYLARTYLVRMYLARTYHKRMNLARMYLERMSLERMFGPISRMASARCWASALSAAASSRCRCSSWKPSMQGVLPCRTATDQTRAAIALTTHDRRRARRCADCAGLARCHPRRIYLIPGFHIPWYPIGRARMNKKAGLTRDVLLNYSAIGPPDAPFVY